MHHGRHGQCGAGTGIDALAEMADRHSNGVESSALVFDDLCAGLLDELLNFFVVLVPPKDIREAMEKQMRAEREKREAILKAEGQKQSAILKAQGEKEAAILTAEGQKEQMIRIAEGEAESVRIKKEAEALGIKLLNEAHATQETIQLRALETLGVVADGKATKIIVPSELQNLTSILASVNSVKNEE